MSAKMEITSESAGFLNSLTEIRSSDGIRYAIGGAVHTWGLTIAIYAADYREGARAYFMTQHGGRMWRAELRRAKPFTMRSLAINAGKFAFRVGKRAEVGAQ